MKTWFPMTKINKWHSKRIKSWNSFDRYSRIDVTLRKFANPEPVYRSIEDEHWNIIQEAKPVGRLSYKMKTKTFPVPLTIKPWQKIMFCLFTKSD